MASSPTGTGAVPLRVVGDGIERVFGGPFQVGRTEACEVRFEGHARVSRTHLRASPQGDAWIVEDLGSANGLYVDGERVERAEVRAETRIQVGEGGPRLTLTPDASAQPTAPVESPGDPFAAAPDPFAQAVDPFAAMPPAPPAPETPTDPLRPHPEAPDPFAPRPETEPSASEMPDPFAAPASPDPFARGTEAPLPEPPIPSASVPPPTAAGSVTPAPAPNTQTPTPKATTNPLGPDGQPLVYEDVVKRYFTEGDDDDGAGERTKFIRQAYSDIQKATTEEHETKQSRYRVLTVSALVVCVLAMAYAGYREYTVRQLREQAQVLFSELQTYNVAVAERVVTVEQQIVSRPEQADSLRAELTEVLSARQRTAARYDRFVRGLGVYDGLSSEEEAIYRVARAFGESELTIPPAFVDEVKVYVQRWKNSSRFQTAVRTAQVNGYIPITMDALRRNGMPPEFFYLALQESNFDTRIVGPPTRYGYAKGAWQFIPETGERYGLSPGPLVSQAVYDPQDERQDFDKAADAAARYLHDIYTHISQASGLLVCASYNWGEGRIKTKMRGIANDPEHRTYWRFLTEYRNRMPHETKDYVMNIMAAAVIGQNPRMFGIDMDPPLAGGGGIVVREAPADPTRAPRRLGASELERRTAPPAPAAP